MRPQTQSGGLNKPSIPAKPTPKPEAPGTLGEQKSSIARGKKDDYLGLGEEVDPNKLLRSVQICCCLMNGYQQCKIAHVHNSVTHQHSLVYKQLIYSVIYSKIFQLLVLNSFMYTSKCLQLCGTANIIQITTIYRHIYIYIYFCMQFIFVC